MSGDVGGDEMRAGYEQGGPVGNPGRNGRQPTSAPEPGDEQSQGAGGHCQVFRPDTDTEYPDAHPPAEAARADQ